MALFLSYFLTFHFILGAQSFFFILQLKLGEKQHLSHLRKQDVVTLQIDICHLRRNTNVSLSLCVRINTRAQISSQEGRG